MRMDGFPLKLPPKYAHGQEYNLDPNELLQAYLLAGRAASGLALIFALFVDIIIILKSYIIELNSLSRPILDLYNMP